jgi:ligand-binding sensor domain-containing protein/two-component sensor histidine kinase
MFIFTLPSIPSMKRFLLLLCFFLFSNLDAQELFFSRSIAFQNLPSVETYHVMQDSKGFIWITTDGGLCRYDGNTLTTFTVKDGISENVVLKGYEDKKGRLWFSTLSGYFFYYENNRFYPIAANEELKKLCGTYSINNLFFIGEKDTLFCSTNAMLGYLKIPPQGNYKNIIRARINYEKFDRFCYLNKLNSAEAIMGCGKINPGLTNIIYYDGTAYYLPYERKYEPYAQINKINVDHNGNLYLSFGRQLFVMRSKSHTVEVYNMPFIGICFYQDKDGDLWIGSINQGGYLFKHSDLKTKPIRFLDGMSISSILLDREGSIWVTTTQKGLFKSNNKEILILNEKGIHFQKNSDQLNITCVQKKIISVFRNDSIFTDNSFSKFLLPIDELRSSFMDKDYSYFNTNVHLFYRSKKDTNALNLIARIESKEMLKLNDDTLCSINPKAISLIVKSKIVKTYTPSFSIRCVTQLRDKTILVGSRSNNGIFEFKNNTFIPYLPQVPQFKTRINSMVQDSSNNLWIATNEHGLYCYTRNKKLYAYNSLISDKLNSLTLDNKSNLWAATNGELIKINYSENIQQPLIYTFNQSNGLPNFQPEKLFEFNGKIWCCTYEKIFYFDSDKLTLNNVPPLVYINRVLINDKPIILKEDVPSFKFNENNIRIQSTLVANKNTAQKQFLYMLLGYDKEWHLSTLGDIQYTNLSHGTYTFMVYGLNNDKVKSDKPATYTFTIKKPFWFTWWFILLEISIIFIIIFLSFRYWKNKIEKREREKASVNQEISEFKMTALRSQMNPHFIFNAIGSIQHYILKNEVKQSYNYLSKFSMLIRNILNNSRQEYISLTQEINTLRLYIELEQIRFTHPFQLKIEIDEELDMEMDMPTMLIQPYVENSIWHGLMPKESGGILELSFKKRGDSMLVIIRDNGMGRQIVDPEKKHASKGMSITEQRISILTSTNKKKFTTTIIDLKDENGNSIGTEVNLVIPFDL